MLPYSKIQGGTLTATASTPQNIQISSMNPPQYFTMKNITKWGNTGGTAYDVEFWWESSMAQGTANGIHEAATTDAMNAFALAADGVSTYSTSTPPTFTSNSTVTAVTKGSAGGVTVVTLTNDGSASHGPKINVGDFVRLNNVAGMQQISGGIFQVVAITSTTSITIDLDSSAFAASGTTAVCTKVIPSQFYPRAQRIVAITQTNPVVVEVTRDTDFTIGEEVSFRIPESTSAYTTMSGMNNARGVVTATAAATATTCSTVTVNVQAQYVPALSTAFALPTSAQAAVGVGQQPIPLLVPAGSGVIPNGNPPGMNIQDAFDNRNEYVIHLGGTMFANSATNDVWQWQAYYYDEYNNQ